MRNKNGGRSLYPAWMMTTGVLTSVAVGVAANQLLHPQAQSTQELRQLAAAFLVLGFSVFSLVTIIDMLIDMVSEMRRERRERPERERKIREALEALEALAYGTPQGLCGNREEHEPHRHDSPSLGVFWCTADQMQRLPFAAERRRKQRP
jgi:uncharacterized membrane protein YcjF (UPF0283 family)